MRAACLAFVAGAWWLQQRAELIGRGETLALFAAAAVAVVVAYAIRSRLSFSTRLQAPGLSARRPDRPAPGDANAADATVVDPHREDAVDRRGAALDPHDEGTDRRKHRVDRIDDGADRRGDGVDRRDDGVLWRDDAVDQRDGAVDHGDDAAHRRAEVVDRRDEAVARRDEADVEHNEAVDRRDEAVDQHEETVDRRKGTIDQRRGASWACRWMRLGLPSACRVLVGLAAFATGVALASWRAEQRLADALPAALEQRDIVIVGTVAALPGRDDRSVRFPFRVESVLSRDEAGHPLVVPERLALGWYRPGRGRATVDDGSVPDIEPGQRWRLTVRLKRPHGSANPDGFDYEYWLLEEGLRATGSVRPGGDDEADGDDDEAPTGPPTSTRKLDDFVWSVPHVIERSRAALRDRVMTALTEGRPVRDSAPYAGVIVALIVGDQRAIDQSDWTVFNRTGIGHLVSISGLHVSMLAALGAWLVFALWRRHPAWCGRLPAHQAAALAGTLVALLYCLLAGFGVPAQRTLYMIAVVALALWTHRLSSVSRVLCIALAIVVAIDPWAVTGSGFWLSFTAVGSIFYVTSGRLEVVGPSDRRLVRAWHAIRVSARVQWAVTLALTPLTLLFFYQVSIISPIANAIAIPLVSFVVTPLALAGAVLPMIVGAWLLHAAHGLVAWLAVWLQWLSAAPIAVWSGAAPGAWSFASAMAGVAWWLAPRGLPLRWTGALWMVPLFAWPTDRPVPGDVRLTALDIGQGTSVLVETHAANLLYDTGPSYSPEHDAGERIVVPLLRARGIGRLDTMIVSHNDNDHSGGALSILKTIAVDAVFSSLAFDSAIVRASPHHRRCEVGQAWTIDGVRFDLLAPPPDVYLPRDGKALAKPNARSCVLRVEAHGRVMLLTADIEKPQETALVERSAEAIASDAMLVPHHGSRTSSTDAFLDATHPSLAIVQAGYLNRFGHPRPDVMARYAMHGIEVLRNDRDGAITITMTSAGLSVDRYRTSHRRYWYGR